VAAADLALGLTALAMLALRAAGLAVAAALRADHPFVAWATAVSQATLAAFVVLAVVAPPAGAMAAVPAPARAAGLAAGLAAFAALRGRLLPSLGAGLLALAAVRAALGG
jgi:hypothetical protein